jgi:hypothetical protein
MKTEELRKQLLAALREEADEMDLANPAAKGNRDVGELRSDREP